MYVPLRVHGHHSMLTGVDAPRTLLARAAELGLPALALCDVDTLAGAVELARAAGRARAEGRPVRPIFGLELSDPSGLPGRVVALAASAQGWRHLCKLASARQLGGDPGERGARLDGPESFDLVGSTLRWQEGLVLLADHPRLLIELAGRVDARSLYAAISPAALQLRAAGELAPRNAARAAHLTRGADGGALEPRRRAADELLATPKVPAPEPPVPARELVEAARALGIATLAVPDVHAALASGFEDHRARVAIKHNALLADLPESWLATRPLHLLTPAEMRALYADLPEASGPFARRQLGALERTLEVAERCAFELELGGILFPQVELGNGETPYSRLAALAFAGAGERYRPLKPEVVRRLDHELATIERLGFASYFLLVKQIGDFARERGIPCVGRGSAADSLVAYCLRLTDADPLRYRLIFERFLNPARRDRPDIDLDFCWRRRDEVLEHVYGLFGAERTAMIATIATCGARAAFRESALALGVPPAEANRWSRRLPMYLPSRAALEDEDAAARAAELGLVAPDHAVPDHAVPDHAGADRTAADRSAADRSAVDRSAVDRSAVGRSATGRSTAGRPARGAGRERALPSALAANPLARLLARSPEARAFPFEDPRLQRALAAAARLAGAPRHFGLHPGGVVVAPGPISDFAPCQRAAKGCIVTQFDKDAVEAVGLVKMDLLGNRALTTVDDCLRSLAARGVAIDLESLPEDEPATAKTLAEGRTLGCFQVESPGMRNLLQQIGARTMDDVIQAVALIRPGPAGSGMKDAYVRRARGLEPRAAPHPRLTELLWDTCGVMLYQEDVMQVASLLAGMELAEADLLRRALQKRRPADLAQLAERFVNGCLEQGVSREDALRAWDLVANFASFGFCKAHAVTYGRIAWRAVWLKTHHPADYLAAFLASETGYYDARVYVEEARRLGVAILPPDVNKSARTFGAWLDCSGCRIPADPNATSRTIEPGTIRSGGGVIRGAIRVGLGQVKGLSERTRERILEERERGGLYSSLPDFLERTRAATDEAQALIRCGAFDSLDRTIPELLWRLQLLRAPARRTPRGAGLDARELDALQSARGRAAGWGGTGIGVGNARLAPGASASLFGAPAAGAPALPRLADYDAATRGRLEHELLGLTVSAHPTALFPCPADARIVARARAGGERARPANPIPCAEVRQRAGARVTLRGWPVATRHVPTADGRTMRFLTLEDETGLSEVVVFPDVYERDGAHLSEFGTLCVTGSVEDHFGACSLHAEVIW